MSNSHDVACAAVRKYLGHFETSLRKGDRVRFNVDHRFNTYDFSGAKRIMFTTQSSFGNRNLTFGLVWLVMGVLCGMITTAFLLVGWKQLWSGEERAAFLKQRWHRGNVHAGRRSPGMPNPLAVSTPR